MVPLTFAGVVPHRCLFFSFNDLMSSQNPYRGSRDNALRIGSTFTCAQAAVLSAGVVFYPLQVLTSQVIVGAAAATEAASGGLRHPPIPEISSIHHGLSLIVQHRGIAGLWWGFPASSCVNIGFAMTMVIYSEIKRVQADTPGVLPHRRSD